jgi:hypothetical protein
MKFSSNIYRPKKLIQDIRRVDTDFFESKDIIVTPHTKIGDAVSRHKEQKAGRIPSLSQKLKPNQLATKALQPRRAKSRIKVHAADKSPIILPFRDKIAAMMAVITRFARHAYGLLPRQRWTLPLVVSACLLIIGGVSALSVRTVQQASIQNASKLSQDKQRLKSANTTKKRAKTRPDQNNPTPASASDSTATPDSSSGAYSNESTSGRQGSSGAYSVPLAQNNTAPAIVPGAATDVTNQVPTTTPAQPSADTSSQPSITAPTPTPTVNTSPTSPATTPTTDQIITTLTP